MVIKKYAIYSYLFILSYIGYPLVATITQLLSINNTNASVLLRAIVLLLAISSLIKLTVANIRGIVKLTILASLCLWFLYFSRILLATAFDPQQLVHGAAYYWIWGAGTCLIPMLAIIFSRQSGYLDYFKLFKLTYFTSLTICILILINIASQGLSSLIFNGRLQLDALNPISLAHVAAVCTILGIYYVVNLKPKTNRGINYGLGLLSIIIGISLLILTGSRGPMLATVITVIFFLVSISLVKSIKYLAISVIFVILSFPIISSLLIDSDISTLNRINGAVENNDGGVSGRYDAYKAAWDIFLNNPIIGDTITEPVLRTYPHNIILESLMATGVLGFIAIASLIIGCIYLAWGIARRRDDGAWISLLFIEALIGAMFSGAIYSVSMFWVTFAMVVGYSKTILITKERLF